MKNKILLALVVLSIQFGIALAPRSAEAGALGIAIFGSGAILSDSKATGQKTDLWLLTAASAGVVAGGVALLKVGGILGIGGGVILILLDAPDQLSTTNLEHYFETTYPEIDNREWIARVAQVAKENSRLTLINEPSVTGDAKIIEVKLSEAQFDSLIEEAALTHETIQRLRADLL